MVHEHKNNKGNGFKVNKLLYEQRKNEHLKHAKSLVATGDYVQAGEKVWGALSALVNCHTSTTVDVKDVDNKKIFFSVLVQRYKQKTPSLGPKMRSLQLRDADEVFDAIFGLHKFFYGGANYSSGQLQKYLPFFIELLENL